MELPPADAPQIPSGEYQGLPEPPGAAMEQPQAELPLGGVDEKEAVMWAFRYLMPNLFPQENPADQGELGRDTMFPEVS